VKSLAIKLRDLMFFMEKPRLGHYEERERAHVREDGTHLTVNLTVTAIRVESDKITGFPGVALDITERKISEETLMNSEERFELALKGADKLL
jgi:PAS domain S-box-containing protein